MSQTQISNLRSQISDIKDPLIVVKKSKRTLELFDGTRLVKKYKMVLGFAPTGDKEVEGDGRTPEGEFYVFTKNAESRFHLSLGISYPAPDDAKRGLAKSLITAEEAEAIQKAIAEKGMPLQKTALGGEIYIHGGGIDNDWTDGCVALKDEEITELFNAVPVGTKVRILQ
ncbi:MAG: L,D-transpeptidase family protein [Pyrinomonadaceae bacterium]|nr:L,D-transpeptidase family protein [Acidobacteriota bacterium]MBP7377218.1 L,D-transpeptidase family protein [Pyrinomonadaceae bacterium]